jgi:hypothetical protein
MKNVRNRVKWALFINQHAWGRMMKLVLVGIRDGKAVVNFSFAAVVAFLSCIIGVGLAFLFQAVAPEWPILTNNMQAIGFIITVTPPIAIVGSVAKGLRAPPDQLAKLD